jgi:hypothetical protein
MFMNVDSLSRLSKQVALSTKYSGSKLKCARPWTCRKGTSPSPSFSFPAWMLAVSTLMVIVLTRKFERRLGMPVPSKDALETPQRKKWPMTFKNSRDVT